MKVKVKGNKDLLRVVSGIFLIGLVFVLNGFLSFITVGFNFENIKTATYWASFAVLMASELAVMFGVYIIQKSKDLQKDKITNLQTEISKQRDIIYFYDMVSNAEDWLREIYNYKEKLLIFENTLKSSYEKLKMKEPKEYQKFYEYRKKKYDKQQEKKKFLLEQMELVKKDKEKISYLVTKNIEEANKIQTELDNTEYAFKTAKIKYKDVYWGNLMSDAEETRAKENTPFFNEKKELSKDFIRYFGTGLMSSAFISALVFPTLNSMGWQTVLTCISSLVVLIIFMVRGASLSHKIILGRYYKSLERRKSIYVKMLKDLGVSKVEMVED